MLDTLPELLLETEPKFPLGHLTATPWALASVPHDEMQTALNRHAQGDWGDLDERSRKVNDRALLEGSRKISSRYESKDKVRFWIITECDRSTTTILLAEDY